MRVGGLGIIVRVRCAKFDDRELKLGRTHDRATSVDFQNLVKPDSTTSTLI